MEIPSSHLAGLLLVGAAFSCSSGQNHPSDDAAATATTARANEVCRSAITTLCQRLSACQDNLFENCVTAAELCPDFYFNDASNRTVDGIASCTAAIANMTCTDFELPIVSCLALPGVRPAGDGCAYPSQCQGVSCSGDFTACGICEGLPFVRVADDQSCGPRPSASCMPGSFCHPQTHVCTATGTIVHAAVGEPCDLFADPVVGCEGDLLCVVPTPASGGPGSPGAGTCAEPPGVDQPCDHECGPGLRCDGTMSGVVDRLFCRSIGACGAMTCDGNSYCAPGADGGMICAPPLSEGAVCGRAGGGETLPCAAPASCRLTPGSSVEKTCRTPRKAGEECDDAHPCVSPILSCTAGQCVSLRATTCPARVADAAAE